MHAVDGAQQRGFSAAVGADETDEFAGLYGEQHVLDEALAFDGDGEIVDGELGHVVLADFQRWASSIQDEGAAEQGR